MPSFKDIFAKYKTYDTSNGFGNPEEWFNTFKQRFTTEEARKIVENDSIESLLGITKRNYTFEHAQSCFRKKIMDIHPDRGGSEEEAKKVLAAWEVLRSRFGK